MATALNEPFGEDELDFDSVVPTNLDKFRWMITTNTPWASQAPANFRLVASKRPFQLWERTGPTIALLDPGRSDRRARSSTSTARSGDAHTPPEARLR